MELQEDYKNTVADRYRADVEELDFSHPHVASNHINGWVNKSTHGLIPTLVEAGRKVLTNRILGVDREKKKLRTLFRCRR